MPLVYTKAEGQEWFCSAQGSVPTMWWDNWRKPKKINFKNYRKLHKSNTEKQQSKFTLLKNNNYKVVLFLIV